MRPTFIVTSAIDTNIGVYSPDIRILQTHETVNSIQKYFPDALLILVEGGRPDFIKAKHPNFEQLRQRFNVFLDMTENDQIDHLHNTVLNKMQNKTEMGGISGLSKTVAELSLMMNVLDAIQNHEQLKPVLETDRLFKISGRYMLSPLFEKQVYDLAQGKYVFRQRDPSWIPNAQEAVGTDHGFSSRLWSFDTALLDDTVKAFSNMFDDAMEISQDRYIDIEHLLYKHIGPDRAMELEHTHLMGTIAPNGLMIYD